MTGSYWDVQPSSPLRHDVVHLRLPDVSLDLVTASGVFGATRVDRGTVALLRHAPAPGPCTSVVDLGTGYGPIALTLALREPRAGVWAVDVNERALDLTRANVDAARLANVIAVTPEQVPDVLRFDGLYSNPPIKIGKDALHELLSRWLARLAPGAAGWLVVKQAMGGDSLHDWLNGAGYATERTGSKQGYRLLRVQVPEEAGRKSEAIDPGDLELVNRRTGRRWSVLGHLPGGSGDQVYLLGHARQQAVLKVKYGAWWAEQLTRTVETVEQLRAVGYPTPAVIDVGRLDDERSFLLTAFQPGRALTSLTADTLDRVLDAVTLHTQVHPAPMRDWSAMVTMFLNGGIAEFAFHSQVLPLARRALAMITRPVPALPTGNFVHGDFTLRNMIFGRKRLSAVVDLEGFGTGTQVIDLVALLQTAVHPIHGDTAIAHRLADHAIAAGGSATFAACVVHRVLAALASATEHPDQLPDALQRCEGLLRLLE